MINPLILGCLGRDGEGGWHRAWSRHNAALLRSPSLNQIVCLARTVGAEVCPCRSWVAFGLGAVGEPTAGTGAVRKSSVLGRERCLAGLQPLCLCCSAVAHLKPIFCSWALTNAAAAPPSLAPVAAGVCLDTRCQQHFPSRVPCETRERSTTKPCSRAAALAGSRVWFAQPALQVVPSLWVSKVWSVGGVRTLLK